MGEMKKITTFLIIAFCVILTPGFTQVYSGYGYANKAAGTNYKMPGKTITDQSGTEMDIDGVIPGYNFDVADLNGPNLTSDNETVFGIYTNGTPSDAGGTDIRKYSTAASTAYTPIRWNNGSQMFRQSGQWVRYSVDFEKGRFNFLYRGNIASFAMPKHKFDLKVYKKSNIGSPLFSATIDLTNNFPNVGSTINKVLRIGGGNNDTDWFKLLTDISISEAGTYMVELSTPYFPFSYSAWGAFTFNSAASYDAKAYLNNVWIPVQDTIKAWQYDKINDGKLFANGDKDQSVGVYSNSDNSSGTNIRGYTDNPNIGAIRWNNSANTFQTNGAWYNYSFKFPGNTALFFIFRGKVPVGNSNASLKIIEPNSKLELVNKSFSGSLKFVSNDDQDKPVRWMYLDQPFQFPQGQFIVQLDFPESANDLILGEFTFSKDLPSSKTPQVIHYNWPVSIPKSDKYEVKIFQGATETPMFTHISTPNLNASTFPEDNGGNGVMPVLEDRSLSFCQFAFSGEIMVEVKKLYGTTANRVEIQPKAYGINPLFFDGRTVRFKLKNRPDKPNYISVNFVCDDNLDPMPLNNHIVPKHGMMLFADKPEVFVPDKNAPGTVIYNSQTDSATIVNAEVIYFPAGDYNLKNKFKKGVLVLTRDNQKVYAEGGAYIRGAVWSESYKNVWLYGRGIFTGSDMRFHELLDKSGQKEAFMKFYGSDGCHVEGIVITNATHHTIPTGSNTYMKNVKIIGWAYNQDGTRTGGNSYFEEMFYKTNDDRDYGDRNHILKNSVEWPMRNGASSVLGWGSYDGGNARYENIYYINSEWERPESTVGNQGVLGSRNKQGSNISGDTLRNLYLEDYTTILTVLRHSYDPLLPFDANDPGEFKNFLFENIKVEQPFIKTNGEKSWQRIEGYERNGVKSSVHDVTFRNLVVAGELITEANKDKYFKIDPKYAYNIFFESSDKIHTIRATGNIGGNIFPSGDIAVPYGTSQYVSIQPNDGFRIKNITIDHQPVGRLQTIFLENLKSDHLISVEFEAGTNTFDLQNAIDPNSVLSDTIKLKKQVPTSVISNTIEDQSLIIIPNPVKSTFTVSGIKADEMIYIYNNIGQLIKQQRGNSLNISHFPKGLYIIRSEGKQAKFIKE
jgi:hypothetical protein